MGAERVEPRLIKDWCEDLAHLYKKHDQNRTPVDVWIATMAHCSVMGESIRKAHYEELIAAAMHAFAWMCAFVSRCKATENPLLKCSEDFCEMVYLKYPQKCGLCADDPCNCNPLETEKQKDKPAKYRELHKIWTGVRQRNDLGWWLNIYRHMYGGRIALMTLETIGFHLLEEAGEEAFALRKLVEMDHVLDEDLEGIDADFLERIAHIDGLVEEYERCQNQSQFEKDEKTGKPKLEVTSDDPLHIRARIVHAKMEQVIEFADTFSWFCATLIKLEEIAKNLSVEIDRFDIERRLQKEYGRKGEALRCPRCKQSECGCLFFF